MKKFLFLLLFIFSLGLTSTTAKEFDASHEKNFAPCSTRYEVYINGAFSGWETHYNYSLSCSGQATGIKVVTITPIYA